jgi:ABC-type branched-subunit amino acid transport system ATPase component
MNDVLRVRDVSVSFGAVKAVDHVSLAVPAGGFVLGIAGPNGSGKTTLLNAITGIVPASGSLEVDGAPVRLGRGYTVRRSGIVRAFQAPQVLPDLTVAENVLLGSSDRRASGLAGAWPLRLHMLRTERERLATALDALERVGIVDLADRPAGALAYGQQRLLELARCISAKPRLLMLDEPAAGLNMAETEHLARVVRAIAADPLSLIVIEHKIAFLNVICDELLVLELGKVIAGGPPDQVWSDQRVVDAYLGNTHV